MSRLSDDLNAVVSAMRENYSYRDAVREFKRAMLLQILRANGNNQCRAAQVLGIHRNTLGREIRTVGINPKQLAHKEFRRKSINESDTGIYQQSH